MKKCPVCGIQNEDGALYCLECGARLNVPTQTPSMEPPSLSEGNKEIYCPECGTKNSESNLFCVMCGANLKSEESTLTPKCPSCGEPLQGGELFCMFCGARLKSPSITPPAGIKVNNESSKLPTKEQPKYKKEQKPLSKTIIGVPGPFNKQIANTKDSDSQKVKTAGQTVKNKEQGSLVSLGAKQPSQNKEKKVPQSQAAFQKTIFAPPPQQGLGVSQPTVNHASVNSINSATVMSVSNSQNTKYQHVKNSGPFTGPFSENIIVRLVNDKKLWKLPNSFMFSRGIEDFPWSKDPYISEREAVLTIKDHALIIEEISSINGVFRHLTSRVLLNHGDWFIVGQSLFVFFKSEFQLSEKSLRGGVRIIGSNEPSPWGYLRHLGPDGQVMGIYPLWPSIIEMGQGVGLPHIPSLKERQFRLSIQAGATVLEPLSEGLWLRVKPEEKIPLPVILKIGSNKYEISTE